MTNEHEHIALKRATSFSRDLDNLPPRYEMRRVAESGFYGSLGYVAVMKGEGNFPFEIWEYAQGNGKAAFGLDNRDLVKRNAFSRADAEVLARKRAHSLADKLANYLEIPFVDKTDEPVERISG
ncbi:MAG TPA: hypothetical protein VJK07_01685 [Candidatus Nanoarchaeia archaeon]|nr:hypothetical protein [Candidatus Nanoarchaeia archaeon]